MNTENSNNEVRLIGEVASEITFSHEVYGEGFYSFSMKVMRLSDISDYINITVSDRLLDGLCLIPGTTVAVSGQFRSYNNYSKEGNRLILTVFARDITLFDEEMDDSVNPNQIYLNGFLCKPPVYRTTPFGREITDLLVAVNRAYNKSDYIPCIAWGRNARFCGKLQVGENIRIWGRIQSREYQKKISDSETITKTAFEISISKLEVIAKENMEFDII
ncbi:MAG: single-stranded DNA-binding protein [Ruminococcaceae bacterium]|nr:single-stranded DNA-binding protein [Oscillospiraceae bacterium]